VGRARLLAALAELQKRRKQANRCEGSIAPFDDAWCFSAAHSRVAKTDGANVTSTTDPLPGVEAAAQRNFRGRAGQQAAAQRRVGVGSARFSPGAAQKLGGGKRCRFRQVCNISATAKREKARNG
jgi:hypothetical protein